MTPPRPDRTPAHPREDDGRFRTLATERHFAGTIVNVRVDTVTMPGGGTARREVVEHVAAVAVAALDDDGRIVLIEQYRHPLRRRLWELPAGLMDLPGEDPLTCAKRELREETGLAAATWSVLVDLSSSPGFCTEAIRVFTATGLTAVEAPERADEEADLRVVRVPLADAVAAVLRGHIVNATAVAGILAAAQPRAPLATAWQQSPALPNNSGPIGDAPDLRARG